MLDPKLRVVYAECDADADVRKLILSSAGVLRWQRLCLYCMIAITRALPCCRPAASPRLHRPRHPSEVS